MDLYAAVTQDVTIEPGRRALISTGIRLAIPEGYEAQVRPRSGWAARNGIGMVNSPGTIDSDYRGTVSVILINWGDVPVVVKRRDRIAQLVVTPVVQVDWHEATEDDLPATSRHEGGFGHTGFA